MNSRDFKHESTIRMHVIIANAAMRSDIPMGQKKDIVHKAANFIIRENTDYNQYIIERAYGIARNTIIDNIRRTGVNI